MSKLNLPPAGGGFGPNLLQTVIDELARWSRNLGSDNIADGSITGADIASGTLVGSKLNLSIGAAPPGGPADGDLWLTRPAAGFSWLFIWNAGSSQWEFVGGTPWLAQIGTSESTASTTYVDLTTAGPTLTMPRSGTYWIEYGAQMFNNTAGQINLASVSIGGGAPSDGNAARLRANAATTIDVASHFRQTFTVSAGNAVKLQYRVTGGTGNFLTRYLAVTPLFVT